MPTGSSLWYGHRPLSGTVRKLLRGGFEYFEVSLDFPFPEESSVELVIELKDLNVDLAFHAPLDILLASPRTEIFSTSLKVLKKCLEFAQKFEPEYFNLHMFHLTPTFIFDEVRKVAIDNALKACEFAAKFARESGFDLCIENDKFFVDDFVCPEAKITLDVGHLAIDSARKGKNYTDELRKFIERHSRRIHVVHIHDFDFRKFVDHIPLGKGELDLSLLTELRKIADYHLIEVFWKDSSRTSPADIQTLINCLKLVKIVEDR